MCQRGRNRWIPSGMKALAITTFLLSFQLAGWSRAGRHHFFHSQSTYHHAPCPGIPLRIQSSQLMPAQSTLVFLKAALALSHTESCPGLPAPFQSGSHPRGQPYIPALPQQSQPGIIDSLARGQPYPPAFSQQLQLNHNMETHTAHKGHTPGAPGSVNQVGVCH